MSSGQPVGDNRDKEDRSQSPVHSAWIAARGHGILPKTAAELSTDLDIDSKVEVLGMPDGLRYGAVRWLGRYGPRAIVGLEMERASPSYTSPDFPASLKQFLEFEVSSLKVYLTYLDQVKEDRRFPKKSAFLETKYQQGTGNIQTASPKRETKNQQGMANIQAVSTKREIKHPQGTGNTQGVSTGRETKPVPGRGDTQAVSMKKDPKRLDQSCLAPSPETPAKLKTNLNIGCEVEVKGLPDDLKYGVVRWLGVYNNLRIVGLTMEKSSDRYSNPFPTQKLFYYTPGRTHFAALSQVMRSKLTQNKLEIPAHGDNQEKKSIPTQSDARGQPKSLSQKIQGQHSPPSDPRQSGRTTMAPIPKTAVQLRTDIDINCMVEVKGLPDDLKYGVVRWLGEYNSLPIAGLEMNKSSDRYRNLFLTHNLFNYIPGRTNFVNLSLVMRSKQPVKKPEIPAQDAQMKKLQNDLQRSKETIKSLEAFVKSREKQVQELQCVLRKREEALQAAQATVKSRDEQVRQLQGKLQKKEESLQAVEKSRDELQDELQKNKETLQPLQAFVKYIKTQPGSPSPQSAQTSTPFDTRASMDNKSHTTSPSPQSEQTSPAVDNRASMVEHSLMEQMLKENALYFGDNLMINSTFLASLLQCDILDASDRELVEAKITQTEKHTALFHFILNRGPKAPAAFLNALLITKQPHVIQNVLHTRDKHEINGAQKLLESVEKYFGREVSGELRTIFKEG